jgi:glycogen operon protein
MDWSLAETNADLVEFTKRAISLRAKNPVFRRRRFFEGRPIRSGDQSRDIAWLTPAGEEMTPADWDSGFGKSLAVFLNGEAIPEPNYRGERVVGDSFLLCFNAHYEDMEFSTPNSDYAAEWTVVLDTSVPTGESDVVIKAGTVLDVRARALMVLRRTA